MHFIILKKLFSCEIRFTEKPVKYTRNSLLTCKWAPIYLPSNQETVWDMGTSLHTTSCWLHLKPLPCVCSVSPGVRSEHFSLGCLFSDLYLNGTLQHDCHMSVFFHSTWRLWSLPALVRVCSRWLSLLDPGPLREYARIYLAILLMLRFWLFLLWGYSE